MLKANDIHGKLDLSNLKQMNWKILIRSEKEVTYPKLFPFSVWHDLRLQNAESINV